jgi:hypothetical protein
MKTMTRNFWIDLVLLLLFCLTTVFLFGGGPKTTTEYRNVVRHVHAFFGIMLILVSFVHIWCHRRWIGAAATGKLHGKRVKVFMYCLAAVLMVLAFFTGHVAMGFENGTGSHRVVGYAVLIGLSVHVLKHLRWMAMTARRLVTPRTRPASLDAAASGHALLSGETPARRAPAHRPEA